MTTSSPWPRAAVRVLLGLALVITFLTVYWTYFAAKDLYAAVSSFPPGSDPGHVDWSLSSRQQLWDGAPRLLLLWVALAVVWFVSGLALGRGSLAPRPSAVEDADPTDRVQPPAELTD